MSKQKIAFIAINIAIQAILLGFAIYGIHTKQYGIVAGLGCSGILVLLSAVDKAKELD